jgi:hypothetical protein
MNDSFKKKGGILLMSVLVCVTVTDGRSGLLVTIITREVIMVTCLCQGHGLRRIAGGQLLTNHEPDGP